MTSLSFFTFMHWRRQWQPTPALLPGESQGWLSWERVCLQCRRLWFDPWVGKIPWRREQLPTPVFWRGEVYGLYSPWGHKETDMTEQLFLSLSFKLFRVYFCVWCSVQFRRSVMSDSFQPCGLTACGILQARILEWVAVPFSRGSFQPRDRTQVSHNAGGFFIS